MSATFAVPLIGPTWPPLADDRSSRYTVSSSGSDFDDFFVANYDRLVRSLTAMTGDREQARDAVQDAFVKASARWRRISRYDDPVGWVRRVAINRSRDLHRSEQRRRRREQRVTSGQPRDEPDRSTDLADSMRLAELFGRLPDQQRRAASLFYVEQLPVAEIASVLGLSVGAVKFHLSRARANLRAVVREEGLPRG